jgi:hypothetical protein
MLDEGTTTNPIPVFVAEGRGRHHAVRVAGGTLGLLLAGWLAALAAGLIGFAPLPAISLPGVNQAKPAPVAQPGTRATHSSVTNGPPSAASVGDSRAERSNAAPSSAGGKASASHSGAVATGIAGSTSGPSGSVSSTPTTTGTGGGSTAPPSGTGGGSSTPPSGTGGASQSNPGTEPSWTPPASGTQSATPPRGKSSSAPGASISAPTLGLTQQPSG